MIQRIQTLFLLGVAVLMGMTNAFYIWGENSTDKNTNVNLTSLRMKVIDTAGTLNDLSDDTLVRQDSTWYIAALTGISILIALISIFQYRNRLSQMKLGAMNALVMAATLGVCYYHVYQYEGLIEGEGSIQYGFFMPAGAMLLNIIANRFIRKDEKLVKSVDRIR